MLGGQKALQTPQWVGGLGRRNRVYAKLLPFVCWGRGRSGGTLLITPPLPGVPWPRWPFPLFHAGPAIAGCTGRYCDNFSGRKL